MVDTTIQSGQLWRSNLAKRFYFIIDKLREDEDLFIMLSSGGRELHTDYWLTAHCKLQQ